MRKQKRAFQRARFSTHNVSSRNVLQIPEAGFVRPTPKFLSQQVINQVLGKRNATGPGGIDLTAKRMNLEVEKDPSAVGRPMDLKSLDNIEIKGLYIKDIEIKPLNNLLEMLGVSS